MFSYNKFYELLTKFQFRSATIFRSHIEKQDLVHDGVIYVMKVFLHLALIWSIAYKEFLVTFDFRGGLTNKHFARLRMSLLLKEFWPLWNSSYLDSQLSGFLWYSQAMTVRDFKPQVNDFGCGQIQSFINFKKMNTISN